MTDTDVQRPVKDRSECESAPSHQYPVLNLEAHPPIGLCSSANKLRPLGHRAQGEIGPPGPFLPESDTVSYKQDKMAQKAEKGDMMIMMSIYTAQWEWKAATRDQQQVEAEHTRLARILCSPSKASQPKLQSRPKSPTLKRLVGALGYTGG